MSSSWMLRRVALVRTDVPEELSSSIIRATTVSHRKVAVTSNRRTLRLLVTAKAPSSPILATLIMEAIRSSETSVLTRATCRNNPEDTILYCRRREYLKSYNKMLIQILEAFECDTK
jgi:hypothetical protein